MIPSKDTFVVGPARQPLVTTFHGQAKWAFKIKAPCLQIQGGGVGRSWAHLSFLTPKLQLHIELLSLRITWRPIEQIFHTYGYKEQATLKWVEGVETKSSQDLPYPPTPHVVITTVEVIPEERGVQAVAWGTCTRKRSPITSSFGNEQDLHLGVPKGFRNPSCTLSESQHRDSSFKSTYVIWRWYIV